MPSARTVQLELPRIPHDVKHECNMRFTPEVGDIFSEISLENYDLPFFDWEAGSLFRRVPRLCRADKIENRMSLRI